MSEPSSMEICSQCGATLGRPREKCWLCGAAIPSDSPPTVSNAAVSDATDFASTTSPAPATPTKQPVQAFSFSLSSLLLFMTLASVCLALVTAYPGLGVILCMLLVPALVRTIRVVQHRRAMGLPVSSVKKTGLFLASFGMAAVLLTVISTAAFASFCGFLLMAFSGNDDALLPWAIGVCALAVAAIVLTVAVIRWIRRRYRRDVGRD